MQFGVVTLFPQLIEGFMAQGLLARAQRGGLMSVRTLSPRQFASDTHASVDDAPYGGGSGMVLMPEPWVLAIEALGAQLAQVSSANSAAGVRRVLLTPQGARFNQAHARRLAAYDSVVLVAGRYEGFDERIRYFVDEEISLGDFVMQGGELAALTVIEVVSRLVPGVLGNDASLVEESFAAGLLEYPQFTRPVEFRGHNVPEVLRSGNHEAIRRWRLAQALARTAERRPDLLAERELTDEERTLLQGEAARKLPSKNGSR